MAIVSINDYLNAVKQRVQIVKTATRTSVAVIPFSVFDIAGQPGSGTLAGTSTANGVVPTDATAGTIIAAKHQVATSVFWSSGTGSP